MLQLLDSRGVISILSKILIGLSMMSHLSYEVRVRQTEPLFVISGWLSSWHEVLRYSETCTKLEHVHPPTPTYLEVQGSQNQTRTEATSPLRSPPRKADLVIFGL